MEKLHSVERHNMYFSPNILRVNKPRCVRYVEMKNIIVIGKREGYRVLERSWYI
jgi:hypothetical protein